MAKCVPCLALLLPFLPYVPRRREAAVDGRFTFFGFLSGMTWKKRREERGKERGADGG